MRIFSFKNHTIIFLLIASNSYSQNELIQIKEFGSNPGNLKMQVYDPGNITEKAPLVVVLHGCTQTAKSCAQQTGWNKLAKNNQFYVLYPEQAVVNNIQNCFNWFKEGDQVKNEGEPGSIMQMINYLKKYKSIDSTKIYVIGLSAGAAMSTIMLATYPEVFDKGGVIGGGPYKSAESFIKAGPAMLGSISKTDDEWGDLVKAQNSIYHDDYPELVIFHGSSDPVVNIKNADQLIKQWLNIYKADKQEDEHFFSFQNNSDIELTIYKNNQGKDIVRYFKIQNMGHAISVDTGNCDTQGGKAGIFSVNKKFHSTFWAADFFGIIKQPYSIIGPELAENKTTSTYTVPYTKGSSYNWQTYEGVTSIEGKTPNIIILSNPTKSGYIEVTETDKNGCKLKPCKLWVEHKHD